MKKIIAIIIIGMFFTANGLAEGLVEAQKLDTLETNKSVQINPLEMTEEPVTKWENRKNINIIPTPKEIKISDNVFLLSEGDNVPGEVGQPTNTEVGQPSRLSALIVIGSNADNKSKIGAMEIQNKLKEICSGPDLRFVPRLSTEGSGQLIIKTDAEITEQDKKNYNLILIGKPGENKLLDEYIKKNKIQITKDNPGTQGYIIRFIDAISRTGVSPVNRIAILAGSDAQGTLYACESFRFLIKKGENNKIYAVEVDIQDWPDFKFRIAGSIMFEPFSKSFKSNIDYAEGIKMGKDMIDWCLRHKINGIDIEGPQIKGTYDLYYSDEQRNWYKEINNYVIDRGISPIFIKPSNIGCYFILIN